MKALASFRAAMLPHELAFTLFLGVTWLRLVATAGWLDGDTLSFLALTASCLVLAAWCRADETGFRWRVRLWAYVGVMTASYLALRTAAPKFSSVPGDDWLAQVDARLFGGAPVAQNFASSSALADVMSLCYALFYPVMFAALVHYSRRGLPAMKRFFAGFFTVFGLGYFGYTLLPAAGPYLLDLQAGAPVHGGWLTHTTLRVALEWSNRADCFPSLHVAITAFILGWDWRHARPRFWVQLLPCAGLWVSTVYLRYHYVTDVASGFVLAAVVLWSTRPRGDDPAADSARR